MDGYHTVIDQPTRLPCGAGPLQPYLEVGLHCGGAPSTTLRVHFDDVTFDVP